MYCTAAPNKEKRARSLPPTPPGSSRLLQAPPGSSYRPSYRLLQIPLPSYMSPYIPKYTPPHGSSPDCSFCLLSHDPRIQGSHSPTYVSLTLCRQQSINSIQFNSILCPSVNSSYICFPILVPLHRHGSRNWSNAGGCAAYTLTLTLVLVLTSP